MNHDELTVKVLRNSDGGQQRKVTNVPAQQLPSNCVVLRVQVLDQPEPITGRVGGHGFVSQVEREPTVPRPADHPSEQQRSRGERQVGKFRCVAQVEEGRGARR